ncbi:DUF1039 domain-containing protein [Dongshaea marina]|uniref:DUF1039 domain-containing protein n=1 Tax=Dongshaea marina TaxID=2047966 RepID=UPI00131EF2B8|nr:DUF1039 domain-containing protein [Dongshaea marina]
MSKLLVECAFAAVNNNLFRQAEILYSRLPDCELDSSMLMICQAVILFGMKKDAQAIKLLESSPLIEARAVEALLGQSVDINPDDYQEQEPAVELIRLLSDR